MAASFRFLCMDEFAQLSQAGKLTYLSDAMEELERAKVPRGIRNWDSLFEPATQQQQQQQAQGNSRPPDSD
jgi:hypothetical protein